jgi:methionine synthase I (cobalamin-dependent)
MMNALQSDATPADATPAEAAPRSGGGALRTALAGRVLVADGAMGTMLRPADIGVELTEEMQLVPEQSTDSLVVHHLEAKYFST